MGFFSKRLVTKPRKEHACYLCGKPIKGKQWYIAAKGEGFWTAHAHIDCQDKAEDMCSRCEYNNDCCSDIAECFYSNVRYKETEDGKG